MNNNILCIGEVLIDGITTHTTNNLELANALDLIVGGSVANFCCYLKKCNANATLIATVGDDGFGKKIIAALQHHNIDTQYISISNKHNTSFIAVTKTAQTPEFIAYRDADKEILNIENSLILGATIVHSTAFCLSKAPASQTVLNSFFIANENGKYVSIDWNYAPSIWNNKAAADNVFSIIQHFEPLLKFSIDDVSRYLNKNVTATEAMQFLDTVTAKVICLTCGSKGVYYKTKLSSWNFLPAPAINVKNATGAGDAFWAGFISSYITNENANNAVQKGIETASLKLQDLL